MFRFKTYDKKLRQWVSGATLSEIGTPFVARPIAGQDISVVDISEFYRAENYIVCPSTMEKDKEGRELFYNDVVELYYKGQLVRAAITFQNGLFCLLWPDGYINQHSLNTLRYRYVGNLCENPDLLNPQKKEKK